MKKYMRLAADWALQKRGLAPQGLSHRDYTKWSMEREGRQTKLVSRGTVCVIGVSERQRGTKKLKTSWLKCCKIDINQRPRIFAHRTHKCKNQETNGIEAPHWGTAQRDIFRECLGMRCSQLQRAAASFQPPRASRSPAAGGAAGDPGEERPAAAMAQRWNKDPFRCAKASRIHVPNSDRLQASREGKRLHSESWIHAKEWRPLAMQAKACLV